MLVACVKFCKNLWPLLTGSFLVRLKAPFLRPGLHVLMGSGAAAVKDGRRPPPEAARSVLCAGHAQQPGGENPLCNLMEVKHE